MAEIGAVTVLLSVKNASNRPSSDSNSRTRAAGCCRAPFGGVNSAFLPSIHSAQLPDLQKSSGMTMFMSENDTITPSKDHNQCRLAIQSGSPDSGHRKSAFGDGDGSDGVPKLVFARLGEPAATHSSLHHNPYNGYYSYVCIRGEQTIFSPVSSF